MPSLPSTSLISSPPQLNDSLDGAAERRLREAEQRLREAIEELQRRQRRARRLHPPCDHADESCVANAIGNLCQSFLLSYGVRVGIGILLRAFKLARGQSYSSLLDLKQLVSEKDLIVREEACRIGLLFGGFTGSYHALRCLLRKLRKKETPLNALLAGSVAGLSVLALDDSNRRRTLALYLLARVAQCAYNSAKSKNKFHLWGSHWRHGDALLFALACAQVIKMMTNNDDQLSKQVIERAARKRRKMRRLLIAGARTASEYRLMYLTKQPCHTSAFSGYDWVQELLHGHPRRIYNMLRMEKAVFLKLCEELTLRYALKVSSHPGGLTVE